MYKDQPPSRRQYLISSWIIINIQRPLSLSDQDRQSLTLAIHQICCADYKTIIFTKQIFIMKYFAILVAAFAAGAIAAPKTTAAKAAGYAFCLFLTSQPRSHPGD